MYHIPVWVSRALLLYHKQSPHSMYAWTLGSAIDRKDGLQVVIGSEASFLCNQPTHLVSPLVLYYCHLNSLKMIFVQKFGYDYQNQHSVRLWHSFGIYYYTILPLPPHSNSWR